jgi:ABC-type glycerol-3-phosphate transport system substrate-binding protein
VSDQPDLVYDLDDHTKSGVTWNSQPVIDALAMTDKLVKGKVFEDGANGIDYAGAVSMWYGGKSAMWFGGSWMPAGMVTDAPPALAQEYKVMRNPAWAAGKPHYNGDQAGAALAIYAKGPSGAESIAFTKWLYDGARYSDIMNKSYSMPSTIEAGALVTDPIMKEMTSWLPEGVPHILFGKGSWDAVGNGVQTIFGQMTTPEKAAAQIETDLVASRSK